ncbi:MAG: dipeptide epimerase, partial [Deltaproteobacteria bacterium]|nr:dipeptide epimerase [Deltaproteobacteria bacterium]MBW2532346.1 dipeptide epimerase [Deltaproteobacteria bacterium]
MKITKIEVYPVEMRLQEPYEVAYGAFHETTNIIVELQTNGPHVGLGCAAPDEHVTGERPEQVLAGLADVAPAALRGSDPLRTAFLLQRLA